MALQRSTDLALVPWGDVLREAVTRGLRALYDEAGVPWGDDPPLPPTPIEQLAAAHAPEPEPAKAPAKAKVKAPAKAKVKAPAKAKAKRKAPPRRQGGM